MAMIICGDCGKEMSDSALACPNCGKPRAATQEGRKVGIGLMVGIALLPAIFAWFTLRRGHSTVARIVAFLWLAIALSIYAGKKTDPASNQYRSPTAAPAAASRVTQVGISELLAAYQQNEVGADNRFKGARVRVAGVIDEVKKDILDNLYVTVGTGGSFEIPQLQAFFDDSANQRLGGLQKGQNVTVVCTIDGLMMNVIGKDCQLE